MDPQASNISSRGAHERRATPPRNLTDVWLQALKPPASGRIEIRDSRVNGLMLRLTSTGIATWSVRARTRDGKRTRPTLGRWPAVGIAEARRRALAAIAEIQGGGDPVSARRAARAERAARGTLPTVSERLGEWQAAKAAAWSGRYAAEVTRLCRREIEPALGNRPLAETTRADWTGLIAAKHRRAPGVGSMLYRTASAFLNHAEAHGWISAPLLPRKGLAVLAPAPASRERILSDDELRAIWLAADALAAKARCFLRLLVLTAAREMEVADIAGGEIDRAGARWTIPGGRAKNGRAITLPLPPLALAELASVWPSAAVAGQYRLLGDIAGNGLRGFSKLKARVDMLSGVTGWRWHDLRRTARTGMTRLGVPREAAEAALNHVSGRSALERTYDRHDYAGEVIAALGRWQVHVAALVSDLPSGEVVPLRATR
jgi:integrase